MARPKKNRAPKKLERNWRNKTLEALEKDYWNDPGADSYLVTTCHELRKKQMKYFEIEDLRIMIGQNIGLAYLVPLAIEFLEKNVLVKGVMNNLTDRNLTNA